MRMRTERVTTLVTVLSLTLLALNPIAEAEVLVTEEASSGDQGTEDVCRALYDAEAIFQSLQPSSSAHLDRKITAFVGTTPGWGDNLGLGHEGPLSTTLRLLPRLLNFLNPSYLLSRISGPTISHGPGKTLKITKARKRRVEEMIGLVSQAEAEGCDLVWAFKGKMRMFPPKGVKQDLPEAFDSYKRSLEVDPIPEAQFMVGLFYATGLGGIKEDQGKALLYYTFAALQGYRPAEMALGYRHWAGISVQENCLTALDYYEAAANRAYETFLSGPPGGLSLPLTHTRLSDRAGGIYGPHASWASSGANVHRAAIKASSSSSRGETEQELLEYLQYRSDRGSLSDTVGLGKMHYLGSVYPRPGGISSGAEGVGEIPQDFKKAKEYFLKVAKMLWPVDYDPTGKPAGGRRLGKEALENIREPAMVAAGFLGRMALRGEGGKPDYKRARLWLDRASELGERESMNALGIIHRDGLLVNADPQKAYNYFQAAAGQDLAEAQVNLAKLHLDRKHVSEAMQYLESALKHGSPFEAFSLYAAIHAATARRPLEQGGKPGFCGAAVAWYKLVSERGSWNDNYLLDAEKAWARGEEELAMVGWFVAGEMGSEAAQNNLAYLLDRGTGKQVLFGREGTNGTTSVKSQGRVNEMAMRWWIRSAAQDNVDAMVKVGDYYYAQPPSDETYSMAAAYYQTAADTSLSSMAYWNLGWMYENGIGVKRDWWLAKRSYDLAGDMGGKLPVMLSLAKLYVRSWYNDLVSGGSDPGLNLFEKAEDLPGLWDRIKNLFTIPPLEGEGQEEGEYEDQSGSGSGWQTPEGRRPGGQGEGEGAGAEFDLDEIDDLLETAVILFTMLGIGCLIWLRQRWGNLQAQPGFGAAFGLGR